MSKDMKKHAGELKRLCEGMIKSYFKKIPPDAEKRTYKYAEIQEAFMVAFGHAMFNNQNQIDLIYLLKEFNRIAEERSK